MSRQSAYGGIDIGGSTTVAAVVNSMGEVIAEAQGATPRTGEPIVANSIEVLDAALEAVGMARSALAHVGIGIPGQVDTSSGEVRLAVNLGIGEEGFPLAAKVESELGIPTTVDHDMRVAALGALQLSRRTSTITSLAYIGVGTGIAAGVILDGHIYRGSTGFAGEIGHIPVIADGPPCSCGLRGCLETAVASSALARLSTDSETKVTARSLAKRAESGDAEAAAALAEIADYLAMSVHIVAMTYDVDLTVLGGGIVSGGGPTLEALVRDSLSRRAEQSAVAKSALAPNRLAFSPPESIPGAVGAAALAKHTHQQKTLEEESSI